MANYLRPLIHWSIFMSIDFVPDIKKYPHIYGAHKDSTLIIFVGAGMSALWGCKRWKDMAVALIDACYKHGIFDYWTRGSLINKYASSPRKLITIAKGMLGEKYLDVLSETIQVLPERKKMLPNLFDNLYGFKAIYITTNIDSHFSCLFDRNNVHIQQSKFYSSVLRPRNIIHLHGIIHKPESLVMTIDEYVERYQDVNFKKFLEYMFFNDEYCFVFLGYGADEMELIDFMIEKYSRGAKTLKRFINRYYILLPFFQNEEDLLQYEQLYFNQMNMTVIPYAINAKGYDQLDEVIEVWRKEFMEQGDSDDFYKFSQIIDRNL